MGWLSSARAPPVQLTAACRVLSCPAPQPGDELVVTCSHTDVRMGMWRLDAVDPERLGSHVVVNEGCGYRQTSSLELSDAA